MEKLNWGIIATGRIAETFARGLQTSRTGKLVAVASRRLESAQSFAAKHGADLAFDAVADLLACSEVDAVYIATPHPSHAELAIAAAEAGKHILCEKPMALSEAEVATVFEAVQAAGVQFLEAYMYRCHPQTEAIARLVSEGDLGELRLLQSNFSFSAPYNPEGRLFKKELGGGAIYDVGGYPVSLATLLASLSGETEMPELSGVAARIDRQCGVDTHALANLRFSRGLLAQISVGTQLIQDNTARLYGSEAWLEIAEPWMPALSGGRWEMRMHRGNGQDPEVISGTEDRTLYGIEADTFASLVRGEAVAAPVVTAAESRVVNRVLEAWVGEAMKGDGGDLR